MKYTGTESISQPPLRASRGNTTMIVLRGARLASHLLYGLMLASAFPLLGLDSRRALMNYWSRALLDILQVRLEISGTIPDVRDQGALLVANHISWLDVFVINAAHPSCFVAKSEVRSWPLVGLLCRLTRTVFIERNLRRDTLRANQAIGAALAQGECFALFPEGTSTDGSQVRHFHASLLQGAIDTGCCVQPAAIRYHDGLGLRSDDANYIGDMTLLQSLVKILGSNSLHARLVFLPELCSSGKSRRALADESRAAIVFALASMPIREIAASPNGQPYYTQVRPVFAAQSAYSLLLNPFIGKHRP